MKKPTKAWIGLTERCNSHCKTCNIWRTPASEVEITPDELYKVFSDPFLSEVNGIILSGGEITVRNDVVDCVMALHRALPNAGITFSTNGLLPDRAYDAVKSILDQTEGKIDLCVGTSLDYLGDTHDDIRGTPGALLKVMYLLFKLKDLRDTKYPGLKISFGTVLQKENADNIQEILDFAEENGFTCLIQWMNRSPFYHNEKNQGLSREDEIKAVNLLEDGFYSTKWIWLDWLNGKPIRFDCFALRNFFVLKTNGDVCPCLTHWDRVAGNIHRNTLQEILGSEASEAIQNRIVKQCQGCINSWGTQWSFQAKPWLRYIYYLKHPVEAAGRVHALLLR